jgi:hypothetical protein
MIDRMRSKLGGNLPVTRGDFTHAAVAGDFTLIYCVASTLYGLLSQEAQTACCANAAARLAPGGVFVVEGFIADLDRVTDPVEQRISSTRPHGGQQLQVELRYVLPDELDAMASHAGLRLRDRWRDWHRGPYTGRDSYVSIYQRM